MKFASQISPLLNYLKNLNVGELFVSSGIWDTGGSYGIIFLWWNWHLEPYFYTIISFEKICRIVSCAMKDTHRLIYFWNVFNEVQHFIPWSRKNGFYIPCTFELKRRNMDTSCHLLVKQMTILRLSYKSKANSFCRYFNRHPMTDQIYKFTFTLYVHRGSMNPSSSTFLKYVYVQVHARTLELQHVL